MNRILLVLAGLFFVPGNIFTQSLRNPSASASMYSHLYEINKEWAKQMRPHDLLQEVKFTSDVDRIQTHLQLVETELRQRTNSQPWTAKQQQNRLALLDSLNTYSKRARFPRNTHHQNRQPYFVDQYGTACAVGYLMRATGEYEAVDYIHQNDNYAYVEELLKYPELIHWAKENGFTSDELAWIQPAYAVVYFTAMPFENNLGSEGEIFDLKVNDGLLYIAGDFTEIDGFNASCLVAWNGSEMLDFPGVSGSAKRVAITNNGDIYLSGTLQIEDVLPTVLLAHYNGNEWSPILTEDNCDGTITDFLCTEETCFISGDFEIIQDSSISYFAEYKMEENSFSPWLDFRYSAPVLDLALVGDTLLLAGEFNFHQGVIPDTLAQFAIGVNLLNEEWIHIPINTFNNDTILRAHFIGGSYYYSGELLVVYTIETNIGIEVGHASQFGGWSELLENATAEGMYGIYGQRGLLYGDVEYGIIQVPGQSASAYWPIVSTNGSITAITEYEDRLFIVGGFTEIDGILINGIAQADLLISDTEDLIDDNEKPNVLSDGRSLFVNGLKKNEEIELNLFDQNGRVVWKTIFIATGEGSVLYPPELPSGTYIFSLLQGKGIFAGQVILI